MSKELPVLSPKKAIKVLEKSAFSFTDKREVMKSMLKMNTRLLSHSIAMI